MKRTITRQDYLPFILTIALVVADQLSKLWIITAIPLNTIGFHIFGDFLRIIHVENTGVAFSMGQTLPYWLRFVGFVIFPAVVLTGIVIYYFRTDEFTRFQRWIIASLVGGGIGNIIDRIFRPDGVIDFIDFKFYGLFGMERFPTFNVADSTVVVTSILLMITFLLEKPKKEVSHE